MFFYVSFEYYQRMISGATNVAHVFAVFRMLGINVIQNSLIGLKYVLAELAKKLIISKSFQLIIVILITMNRVFFFGCIRETATFVLRLWLHVNIFYVRT